MAYRYMEFFVTRTEIMQRVHSKDTKGELLLRKRLWKIGYRYRKNCKSVYGKPDIAFIGKKIAIFCDSEFWHGKYYKEGRRIPKTNQDYWIEKFKRNIERDEIVNLKLQNDGWLVLRYWEQDILHKTDSVIEDIQKHIPLFSVH